MAKLIYPGSTCSSQACTHAALYSLCVSVLVSGDDQPKLGLAMPEALCGTAHPYWQRLSDLIVQGSIGSQHAGELRQVFGLEAHRDRWQGRVPSYLLSGITSTVANTLVFWKPRCSCQVSSQPSAALGQSDIMSWTWRI